MALVSVIVPVYYNELNLPDLFERLVALGNANPQHGFEFVFVDDGSKDRSYEVLERLAAEDRRVRVVKLSRNFGSSAAVLAGLGYSCGDCMAVIAADLQDPPELITEMIETWSGGKKVVLAARQGREDPWTSKLLSGVFYWLFRRLANGDMPAEGFDFMLIDKRVAQLLIQMQERNAYLMGLVLWLGFERDIIYYTRRKRELGRSRWTLGKRVKYFIDSFAAFSYVPVRLASVLGFTLAAVGLVYAVGVLLNRLLWHTQVPGWTSLMVVVLIVSGTQLAMLGVLGEYLWRTLEAARNRPPFVVDQTLGFAGEANVGSPGQGSRAEVGVSDSNEVQA
jgi:glycosyltransferase involved in cell wall biosynthesis